MPDFAQLSQFGVAGLAVYLMYKISSNHIDHNTEVLKELASAIKDLKEFMSNHLQTK